MNDEKSVYSVMIVEDDPMVSMINEQYIRKNPLFKVCCTCRNGKEALNYLENNSCDLVILDVYMPYMDGIETLKQIREKKINTEVIMVTAANDTTTLENTMHLGVIDYLIKPFAYARFQVALEKFIIQFNALKSSSILDQNSIDSIITSTRKVGKKDYPKGIQERTLQIIRDYMKAHSGWVSGDTIANDIGLSSVTVRRYMSYLSESGIVTESMNYETGGRPSILYK